MKFPETTHKLLRLVAGMTAAERTARAQRIAAVVEHARVRAGGDAELTRAYVALAAAREIAVQYDVPLDVACVLLLLAAPEGQQERVLRSVHRAYEHEQHALFPHP
jgi:hypothetical protein